MTIEDTRIALFGLLGAALLTASGCAYWGGGDYYEKQDPVLESKSHTAGEVLAQKKAKMRRAQRDLMEIQATLQMLRRHRNLEQLELFEPFVRSYLNEHVNELISNDRESWHPELVPFDANLLFAKATVLIELRDRWRLERLIRRMERRFAGMESLLVEYPAGAQTTVEQGLRDLRQRRWPI